jgi:hypothetical protein
MRTLLDAVVRLGSRSTETRPRHFSLIDFGADTVKAVVVRQERASVRVLGYGFAPAEGRGLSGGRADVAALAAVADEALVAAEDQTEAVGGGKVVPDDALFCIPASLTRGQSFTVRQTRAEPTVPIAARELKSTWERVERLARERLPLLSDDEAGEGPSVTWRPLALTPGPVAVDGHHVTDPVGLKGRELLLSAFGIAVWPSALRAAEAVAERLELALVSVVASPQSLASLVPRREALLISVGSQGTSLNLIEHDALVSTFWWSQGGEFFTRSLAQAFRCPPEEAEALKRAYTDNALSAEDEDLVTRSLAKPVAMWLETLVAGLRRMAGESARRPTLTGYRPKASMLPDGDDSLPGYIYLTGGGSLLPDLSRALLSLESIASPTFRRSLEVESLGRGLGTRAPGRPVLLDVPPHPVSDLLAPAMSLATSLE